VSLQVFLFRQVETWKKKHVEAQSQLNGNQGSWCGTDNHKIIVYTKNISFGEYLTLHRGRTYWKIEDFEVDFIGGMLFDLGDERPPDLMADFEALHASLVEEGPSRTFIVSEVTQSDRNGFGLPGRRVEFYYLPMHSHGPPRVHFVEFGEGMTDTESDDGASESEGEVEVELDEWPLDDEHRWMERDESDMDVDNNFVVAHQINGNNGEWTNTDDSVSPSLALILVLVLVLSFRWVRVFMFVFCFRVLFSFSTLMGGIWYWRGNPYKASMYLGCGGWFYILLLLVCVQMFKASSQINGNNGEWTNTDDSEDNATRVRMHREANTNKFRKAPKGKAKAETRLCRDQGCVNPQCKFVHLPPKVPEIPKLEPEEPQEIARPDEWEFTGAAYLLVKEGKVVWSSYEENSGHKYTVEVEIPQFTFAETRYRGRKIRVVWEIVLDLREKYPLPVPLEKNKDAAMRYLVKGNPKGDLQILENCLISYLYDMSLLGGVGGGYSSTAAAARKLFVSIQGIPVPSRIDGVITDKVNDWSFNRRWDVKLKGAVFEWENEEIKVYPHFKVTCPDRVRYFVTCYGKLEGSVPFQYFDVCAQNCTGALSRLLKGKKEEDLLHQNQLVAISADPELAREMLAQAGGVMETTNRGRYRIRFRQCNNFREEVEVKPDPDVKLMFDNMVPPAWIIWLFAWFWRFIQMYLLFVTFSVELLKLGGFITWCDALCMHYWDMPSDTQLAMNASLPSPKLVTYSLWALDDRIQALYHEGFIPEWSSKIKREIAKFGKFSRLYATHEWATLYDRVLANIVKSIGSVPFYWHKVFPVLEGEKPIRMVSRYWEANSPADSDRMYEFIRGELLTDKCDFYSVYYSDDGFIFGKDILLETDIAGADSSARLGVFVLVMAFVRTLTSMTHALKLVKPLSYATRLNNPDIDSGWMKFTPQSYALYSGSWLTTITNNMGVCLINLGFFRFLKQRVDPVTAALRGAECFGYELEVDVRVGYNNCTFLKRAYSVNARRSWLVYGPILRSIGTVEGTPSPDKFGLPKGESLEDYTHEQLFKKLVRDRVLQLQYEPVSCIINALRSCVGMPTLPIVLGDDDLMDRYSFSSLELHQMCEDISDWHIGGIVYSPALSKIYSRDYGVKDVKLDDIYSND